MLCTPCGFSRRSVSVERLYFKLDGSIRPISLTREGISLPPSE